MVWPHDGYINIIKEELESQGIRVFVFNHEVTYMEAFKIFN